MITGLPLNLRFQPQRLSLSRSATGPRRQHHVQRAVCIFEITGLTDQTGYRAVEVHEKLLANGPLTAQRFVVSTRLIKPNQCARKIDKCHTVLTTHLQFGRRTKRNGFGPIGPQITAVADLC